jgi:CDP-glucose 4,6-dehydratase
VEALEVNRDFWKDKRVLLTGHTGFKGSWLSIWLKKMGAFVAGFALPPATKDSLFGLASIGELLDESAFADIRDVASLSDFVAHFRPEIVFHLAAQSLVRLSYVDPLETFQTNVMGTANILESTRDSPTCRVVVVVTSDKCYENKEWIWGYREDDALGGHDPYSSSKACAEIITASYRHSFTKDRSLFTAALASARAGNVVGGGDFSIDRLVPDIFEAKHTGTKLRIRNPDAVRPWQHVLDALSGYILLAERMWDDPIRYSRSWNFGPPQEEARSVRWLVEKFGTFWGQSDFWEPSSDYSPHEAQLLLLDSSMARQVLGWRPRWNIEVTIRNVSTWYESYWSGKSMRDVSLDQISSYETCSFTEHRDQPSNLRG